MSRLWRWSLPSALMSLAFLMELVMFAGAGWLKYLVFTEADGVQECLLFVLARGAAWGALMGLLALWCLPWSVAKWRGRQVLMDIKLTPLKPREIMAAIWLPPLYVMLLPVFAFSALDLLVVPVGVLYLEGERFAHVEYEVATLFGLLFQFSMIYMAMMLVFTAAIRPSLRERSVSGALWFTLGWTIHLGAIAVLKFFFNVLFIILAMVMCAGFPAVGLLLYGTWYGYHVCDGLKETISEHLHDVDKYWWAWMSGEKAG
jgi:hypothetical protein